MRKSADFVAKEIATLNRLNADVTDYETIKIMMRNLIEGLTVESIDVPSTEQLFRARLNPDSKLMAIKEISAPQADLVTGFQRCNPPGCPMFYTASTRNTALKECNAKPGDRFYLSQWMPKTTYPAIVTFSSGLSDFDHLRNGSEINIYSYLDTIFTRRIHKTFSNDYKFTAAFSEILRARVTRHMEDGSTWSHYVALRYPSVADIGNNFYNTVMHPENADKLLCVNHVMEGVVISENNGKYDIEVTDNAVDFSDGIIHWTGDGQKIPLLKQQTSDGKSGVGFVVSRNVKNEKVLFLCTSSSSMDSSYMRRLLDEPGCHNFVCQSNSSDK